MNVHSWVAHELLATGKTAFELFNDCWNGMHPNAPCKSNRVRLDADKWNQKKLVPSDCYYVHRTHEKLQQKLWSIPFKAAQPVRLGYRGDFVLVDDESPILYPQKMRSGKWMGP